ncbi:hypothetical protein GCK32_005271 [Trichostrongylus colubriformis]|uniref:Uncharacterized protein n=1 Tax=Trichostrongylus colubriformis TaxID=6319 RepID=A0AAN8IS80_TRICO
MAELLWRYYSVFTKCFASYSKYEKWLAEQCDRTCTKFTHRVKHNGALLHLRCDTPSGNPGERRARVCSCFLNVRLKEVGPIVVHGCFGHAGHKLDLTLRSLSVDEELFLEGLLEENSVDRTLELLEGDSCLKASRLALITRKDLGIIIEKYNLSPVPSAPDMMSPLVSELESKPDCGFNNFDQEDCKKNVLDLGSRKRPAVNALEAEDTSDCENQGDVIEENHDTCLLAISLMSNDSPSSSLQTEASPEIQEHKDSLQMEVKDEGNFSIDTKSDVADELHSNVGIPVIELIKIEEEKVFQKPAKLEV